MDLSIRLEPRRFPNASPAVRYEVDASDVLVSVNDAWQMFAVANDATHLMRERVVGRSLWDFLPDNTTRLVYDILLRQVREGGRSRFEYRGDSPERRRLMEMIITAGGAGRVVFESATLCVERHDASPRQASDAPNFSRCCGWCKRTHSDRHGWIEIGADAAATASPDNARTPVITEGMCADCYSRVMNSVQGPAFAPSELRRAEPALPIPVEPTPARLRRPAARVARRSRTVVPARHAS